MTDATYTLQVNENGAWRNVCKGSSEQMREAEHHAAMLASIMGNRYKWRIIDAAFGDVLGYCEAPGYVWRQPGSKA